MDSIYNRVDFVMKVQTIEVSGIKKKKSPDPGKG